MEAGFYGESQELTVGMSSPEIFIRLPSIDEAGMWVSRVWNSRERYEAGDVIFVITASRWCLKTGTT